MFVAFLDRVLRGFKKSRKKEESGEAGYDSRTFFIFPSDKHFGD